MPSHFFAQDQTSRDARCTEKDAIVRDVISKLSIPRRDASNFSAVLMPAAHGPEVDLLAARGVSTKQMFAIERDPKIRLIQERRGLSVPPLALSADKAIDHVPFEHVDFCYLDFLGRPSTAHLETIRKLFRLELLRPSRSPSTPGSCLLVTLGVNRGDGFSCPMISSVHGLRGDAWLRAAVSWARGLQPKTVKSHQYTSSTITATKRGHEARHTARFVTTEMWF